MEVERKVIDNSLKYKLDTIIKLASQCQAKIDGAEILGNNKHIYNLIEKCQQLDVHYKQYCDEVDEADDAEPGTTYRDGISIEFYIEADWWHDISLILREMNKSAVD